MCLQLLAAVISVAVENDGTRGYTSFVLPIIELNLVVWVGYYSDRNAGNAIKELQVSHILCALHDSQVSPSSMLMPVAPCRHLPHPVPWRIETGNGQRLLSKNSYREMSLR